MHVEESAMKISPSAGKPPEPGMLVNVPRLIAAYYVKVPDASVPAQRVAFGTSGHRGSAFDKTFNESHILAITQAICLYREQKKIAGPAGRLYGKHPDVRPGRRRLGDSKHPSYGLQIHLREAGFVRTAE
jgi:hypothetical protein